MRLPQWNNRTTTSISSMIGLVTFLFLLVPLNVFGEETTHVGVAGLAAATSAGVVKVFGEEQIHAGEAESTTVGVEATNGAVVEPFLVQHPEQRDLQEQEGSCRSCFAKHVRDPTTSKSVYKVGVLAIRGVETAYQQYNSTFADYLTATAGQQFVPPIQFELHPVAFQSVFDDAKNGIVDFLFVSPSPLACVEAEYGAQSLVSMVSTNIVNGQTYTLSQFAGVIIARANNTEINTIHDLKDKIVASVAISGFGAGQLQFREMQNAGMSFINDPKQMVFTHNQAEIVNGVLAGNFDVGFVRTQQMERTKDPITKQLIDKSKLKVLQSRINVLNDGQEFPYEASTPLYPEWNVASLSGVPKDVNDEVQRAFMSIHEHGRVGQALQDCINQEQDGSACDVSNVVSDGRCDTTNEIAVIAHQAMQDGGYAGFHSASSYVEVHAMLADTKFINKDPHTGIRQCVRPAKLYEAIKCPAGHFKKKQEDVEQGCTKAGLSCSDDDTCICKPCVKAYDVDVAPKMQDDDSGRSLGFGCGKMTSCGTTQQRQTLPFVIVDNLQRPNANLSVTILEGQETKQQPITKGSNYTYEFEIASERVGVLIIEIFINDEQIPESPLRVHVEPRDCDLDYEDGLHEPNSVGICQCRAETVTFGNVCVHYYIFFPSLFIPLLILSIMGIKVYGERKKRQADAIWTVNEEDLQFSTPPKIIGQGAFGEVRLAEYRGTQVAVKRVLPPQPPKSQPKNSKLSSKLSSILSSSKSLKLDTPTTKPNLPGPPSASQVVLVPEDDILDDEFVHPTETYTVEDEDVESNVHSTERTPEVAPQSHQLSSVKRSFDGAIRLSGLVPGVFGLVSGGSSTSRKCSGSKGIANRNRSALFSGSGKLLRKWFGFVRGTNNSATTSRRRRNELIKELRLLSTLRHPCVVTVMGAVMKRGEEPLLIMEYMCYGSLYDLLRNETILLTGEELFHILKDIVQGVRYLHSVEPHVVHGDLKAANILVDSKLRAKVSDFGLAHKQKDPKDSGRNMAHGTPYFMAPEVLRGETGNTKEADMYAMGMLLYEMYSRKDPYDGERPTDVLRLVCDKRCNKRPPTPRTCPPKVAKLMKFLLMGDPKLRPTATELDHRLSELNPSTFEPNTNPDGSTTTTKSFLTTNPTKRDEHLQFLYQVFPRHVADILHRGGKVEPESHDCVTIFFSDIVGFTTIASKFPPLKVSSMLDRLYLAFDALIRKHGVFKIETIGDAYMCASNLENDQHVDHVKRIALFAIDAIEAASTVLIDQDDPSKGTVAIRVGFHSGPVVSNVVGSINTRYGLFGDTVNVSARMESTSALGRIQCSEFSAKLLMKQAPKIHVVKRGETTVKGKGKMMTYWVSANQEAVEA